MVRVDLRTVVLDIPPQDLITRDNVPAKVNAVTYFRVIDASSAIVKVERYLNATSQIAQTTLRSILGKADLDMLLGERERLNEALQQIIDEQTDPWGVKVTAVEIKDVEIPTAMQRAMARQAEAERERRAKVIHAEGEFQASQRLYDAAEVIAPYPAALRMLHTQVLHCAPGDPMPWCGMGVAGYHAFRSDNNGSHQTEWSTSQGSTAVHSTRPSRALRVNRTSSSSAHPIPSPPVRQTFGVVMAAPHECRSPWYTG